MIANVQSFRNIALEKGLRMPCLKKSLVRENEGIYLTCDTLSFVIKIHVKVDPRPGQVLIRGFNPF